MRVLCSQQFTLTLVEMQSLRSMDVALLRKGYRHGAQTTSFDDACAARTVFRQQWREDTDGSVTRHEAPPGENSGLYLAWLHGGPLGGSLVKKGTNEAEEAHCLGEEVLNAAL